VIAADLGALHAMQWGWHVDLLVGDLDSLPSDASAAIQKAGAEIMRVPAAKDQTDTELAIARALEMGAEELVICGATGGRTDHLLANVLLLVHPALAQVDTCLVDGGETLRMLRADHEIVRIPIVGAAGDLVSLLPLGTDAIGISTDGLVYPLNNETLRLGEARGISNLLSGSRAHISLRHGCMLVIHYRMGTK
jgi:thiamine pyrophosphokinase